MKLIRINSLKEFKFSHLIQPSTTPTQRSIAIRELFEAFDSIWGQIPPTGQDFMIRFFRSCGAPIDYPSLPFWAERAARHIFSIFYPTLRNSDFNNPTTEDVGRATGHLLAMASHARAGSAIFRKLPPATLEVAQTFFSRIEAPIKVLVADSLSLPFNESKAFLNGMNHAYTRTFDAVGLPKGWNTNSPVMLGICLAWKSIVTKSPSLDELHRGLAQLLGEQILGSDERVKKVCQRLGLRFSGNRATDRQGTNVILDVPTGDKLLPDR